MPGFGPGLDEARADAVLPLLQLLLGLHDPAGNNDAGNDHVGNDHTGNDRDDSMRDNNLAGVAR
jgi:hypothetical protein